MEYVKKLCVVDGCETSNHCKGYCQHHYNQIRRDSGYFKVQNRKPSTRFTTCKKQARYRELEWSISFETFKLLIQKSCHYCNGELPATRAGLDRKDSDIGYTEDNVVPCCYPCNNIKSDNFTYEEFLEFSKTKLFTKVVERKREYFKSNNKSHRVIKNDSQS